ncbi:MAG: hypothetical protein A3C71_00855 [Candidatus Yanofskybacteria bacterium RIFCSPHIGHO2_02_FULL_43_15c]|uniref:Uncharacterized protein n=1 Tax=Candidatus Yanofskybacteria bacterium RIFCSPHIGHO2_02_FULL_43_15c TaxID=1802679 RepID=A0A1F8FEL2_9BACT|nr:MAG: hypothetical protein A3C71_00855 [Candidatus Yanofskybacteria bacterium RIFCSPHIGHO2_02_FULL_43_15c]
MLFMPRFFKQFLFALLFLVIFGGGGFWIYKVTRPEMTCFDKIQNQNEEGIDCGEVCGNVCLSALKSIEVRNSYLFTIDQGFASMVDYDALFKVSNPNTQFGSAWINYELTVFDDQNQVLLQKPGRFYILPGQTKYIYESSLQTKQPAGRVELKTSPANWEKLTGVFSEDVKFVAKSKDYLVNDRPGVYSRVNGTLFNASDFDVDRVEVVAVLFKEGQPMGAGRTTLTTFPAKSDRFFEITWINPIETPDRVEIEANTNVFQNSNFLRKYGTPEKFQQPL